MSRTLVLFTADSIGEVEVHELARTSGALWSNNEQAWVNTGFQFTVFVQDKSYTEECDCEVHGHTFWFECRGDAMRFRSDLQEVGHLLLIREDQNDCEFQGKPLSVLDAVEVN